MGELADIGVTDLLYIFDVRRQTGKLTISANGDEISLFLEDGRLVLVTSTNLSLRLGRLLLRLGLIDAIQLRKALQEQEAGGPHRSLGRILVDRGWLAEADLARCVEEQCIRAMARVIGGQSGVFVWTMGTRANLGVEIVSLNTDRILLEAIRRTDELAMLSDRLPPPDAPLFLCTGKDDAIESMTEAEFQVASALQSSAGSLTELTEQVTLDEVAIAQTVVSLRERGLILAGHEPREEPEPNGSGPAVELSAPVFAGTTGPLGDT
jgi:hypothetical protein